MKDNKETLDKFKESAENLLDSLKAFAPSIEAVKELSEVEFTDSQKAVLDQFNIDAKGQTDIGSLIKLKEEYLQKLKDVV